MDIVKGTRVTQVDAARAPITQVRYSPCGKFLGCTCEDGVFRVLGVFAGQNGGYEQVDQTDPVDQPTGPHDAGIEGMTHIDWSEDSRFVQINTSGGGLKFFSAPACDPVDPADPLVRDAEWATWQSPPDVAGHVIEYRITQETRVHNACR